jgi:hypothetical protein
MVIIYETPLTGYSIIDLSVTILGILCLVKHKSGLTTIVRQMNGMKTTYNQQCPGRDLNQNLALFFINMFIRLHWSISPG